MRDRDKRILTVKGSKGVMIRQSSRATKRLGSVGGVMR